MLKTLFTKAFWLRISFFLILSTLTIIPLTSGSVSLDKEMKSKGTATHFNSPQIKLNKKGILFVRKYIKNSSECLVGIKKRSTIPFTIIDSVFIKYNLPVELKYLAVIESELKSSAQSQVGARGPWQLMPGTARILGLKVSRQYDERTNYHKSTVAAARYLKDLYVQFNDWLLVLAAYNGGPKPVYTAINKSGSRNFWVLQNYLPAESRNHVKKFIATHYYFEGRGSVTTLTKEENIAYKKMVLSFLKSTGTAQKSNRVLKIQPEKIARTETSPNDYENITGLIGFNYNGVNKTIQEDQHFMRESETADQKFKRLMKESEESLKNCRKII